jgi:glycosyltransferase involved in cell wall biosynthesis
MAMRVLLVDTAEKIGGAQRSLIELAAALRARGEDLCAAVPPGPLAEALRAGGVAVADLPPVRLQRRPGLPALAGLLRFARAILPLARAIRRAQPDILHANGSTAALLAAQVRGRRPLVWHVRDLALPPAVVRRLAFRVACAAAISESVEERLVQSMPRFRQGCVRLLRNAVDADHFVPGDRAAARRRLGLAADVPLVGMLAHVSPWKRHDHFLAIAERVRSQRPQVRFLIGGRDLFREHARLVRDLQEDIRRRGLQDALDWRTDLDDSAEVLPALDVLVHPTAEEPFGRVLCEAMAAGRPVVAADAAGPSCIVPDGVAGFLVPPGRFDQFAQKVLALLADPALANRMGAAGRQHVLANFAVARLADDALALYRDVLDRRAPDANDAVRLPADDDDE